jgi:hypothetical protein
MGGQTQNGFAIPGTEIYPFCKASTPAPQVTVACFHYARRPEREAYQLPPLGAEVKNEWSYTFTAL